MPKHDGLQILAELTKLQAAVAEGRLSDDEIERLCRFLGMPDSAPTDAPNQESAPSVPSDVPQEHYAGLLALPQDEEEKDVPPRIQAIRATRDTPSFAAALLRGAEVKSIWKGCGWPTT